MIIYNNSWEESVYVETIYNIYVIFGAKSLGVAGRRLR